MRSQNLIKKTLDGKFTYVVAIILLMNNFQTQKSCNLPEASIGQLYIKRTLAASGLFFFQIEKRAENNNLNTYHVANKVFAAHQALIIPKGDHLMTLCCFETFPFFSKNFSKHRWDITIFKGKDFAVVRGKTELLVQKSLQNLSRKLRKREREKRNL